MSEGMRPFIGAVDNNNGVTAFIGQPAIHERNTITVNYNGNGIAEAYFQGNPSGVLTMSTSYIRNCSLTPHKPSSLLPSPAWRNIALAMARNGIWNECSDSQIRLPVRSSGKPDWQYMEKMFSACLSAPKIG
jgi:hypothetical protein